MTDTFLPQLDTPIRFVAVRWSEDWEFDHPTMLIEPIVRYSPNGDSCESMIEDAAIDIAANTEEGKSTAFEDITREFEWRGWSLDRLRTVARQSLAGKEFPKKGYRAIEQWFVFKEDEGGEIVFSETEKPGVNP